MILPAKHAHKYLEDYKAGLIPMGLDIGEPMMDRHIRFKHSQFVMLNGFDNVGKTAFMLWYYLCLSVKHGLTWCIWSGENKPEQLTRQIIEFYSGKKLKNMETSEIYAASTQVDHWFKFVCIKDMHNYGSLLEDFKESECDGCLIDPFTGLDKGTGNQHLYNYEFCNNIRQHVNNYNQTIYVNTHPNTEAARKRYPLDHELAGHQLPPSKADSEGGQPFANRADDFLTGHRLTQHPETRTIFNLYVRKIKDIETGGMTTDMESPIPLHYNNGLGYIVNDFNPLKQVSEQPYEHEPMKILPDTDFFEKKDNAPW